MAFLLTLLYTVLSHLSPEALLPDLAPYRIMLWLAVAAAVFAIPRLAMHPTMWRSWQIYLMLGFMAAVPLSRIAHGWFGGAFPALSNFMVSGIIFFFVVASVNTIRKLHILVAAVVLSGLFLLSQSLYGFYRDGEDSPYVIKQSIEGPNGEVVNQFPRLRSVGFLEDPNDFAQFLLVSCSFLALAWRPGRRVRNLALAVLPAAYILYGIYSTDSRGALFGLAILSFLAFESRMSRRTSLVLTTILLGGVLISQAAGPRAVSLNEASAAGRVEAWGTGISMLKSSPLFGAGFDSFLNYEERTAHNSFVLCFAELGLVGYLLWLGLIVFTLADLNQIVQDADASIRAPDVVRCARVIRAALLAFLATAWFLSRTYIVTFYLLIGMAVAARELLREHTELEPVGHRSPWRLTLAAAAASVAFVYITVRLKNL